MSSKNRIESLQPALVYLHLLAASLFHSLSMFKKNLNLTFILHRNQDGFGLRCRSVK